jgi:uncharacterized protein (TIGR04255 family)
MSKIYTKPPIVEAIFDVQVTLPDDFVFSDFELFHKRVRETYKEKKVTKEVSATFTVKKASEPQMKQTERPLGYILRNNDEGKVVQARVNGFTFSKLKPYSSWDEFSDEAFRLWDEYSKLTKPIKVSRIALRYINKIVLPRSMSKFQEYVKTTPDIAHGLPQAISEMFMRIVMPHPTKSISAIVTETIDQKNITDQSIPLIFDIDVFELISSRVTKKDLVRKFSALRQYKNTIFEKSLTTKAKELFNG